MRAARVALSGERRLPACRPRQLAEVGDFGRNSDFVARRCFEQSCQQLQAGSLCAPELKALCENMRHLETDQLADFFG